MCCSLSQCKVSPDETFLIISGSSYYYNAIKNNFLADDLSNISIFSLDITYKTVNSTGPWFPKLRDVTESAKKSQNNEIRKPILDLTLRQQLNSEECGTEDIQVILVYRMTFLLMYANVSISHIVYCTVCYEPLIVLGFARSGDTYNLRGQ